MLTLINTNRILPPIAPIGLDYLAGAVRQAGYAVELLDLCLADDPTAALDKYFAQTQPDLVGLSFRNLDDCFWPGGQSYVPTLQADVAAVRQRTEAPIVLGGVGYSVMPQRLLAESGADFGIHGDGEAATIALLDQLRGARRWSRVPGLVYRDEGRPRRNPVEWPRTFVADTSRDLVDNPVYFRRGGQLGVETKRGCGRRCTYCVDPLAKGPAFRLRDPREVADEIAGLADRGIDVLHLCDAEFNLPPRHALDVCQALIARRLDERVRWYAYLAVVPFSAELAAMMRRAGCAGINFTSDSANAEILAAFGQPHRRQDLAAAVQRCRQEGIAVMLDMLLGGPGETPQTVDETIAAFQQIDPDCAGAALGVRLFPGTPLTDRILAAGPLEQNPHIRRRYSGPVDLLQPTFYVSAALGDRPAAWIRQRIGDDPRFFPPQDTEDAAVPLPSGDHNYSQNQQLVDSIAAGERGAYWHILRKLRCATVGGAAKSA